MTYTPSCKVLFEMEISPSPRARVLRMLVRSMAAALVVVVGALHLTTDPWHVGTAAAATGTIVLAALLAAARWEAGRSRLIAAADDAKMRALLHSTLESTTDGIITVDREGRVVSHNQRFCEMWGVSVDELGEGDARSLLKLLERLADPEVAMRRIQEIQEAPEGIAEDYIECADGRVLHRTSHPHRLDGRTVGRVWSFRDITQQRRTEVALAASEQRFRRMVKNVPGVIFQFYVRRDNTLWFTYLSEGCQALLGVVPPGFPWRADSLVQRVAPDDMRLLIAVVTRATKRMESWTWEGRVTIQAGLTRWLRAASRPTRHPDGKITWDGLLMDVTEEKLAAEALERREEQLAEAQALAHIGSWDWDLASDSVAISAEHWRIFGHEPEAFEWSYEHYLAAIHEEDRGRVQESLALSLRSGEATSLDYRIVRPDGSARSVTSRGKVVIDDDGNPCRVVGSVEDVTDRRRNEEALQKRVRVEQALTRAARILSGSGAEEISSVLELVGDALGADRAYLFQSRPDSAALVMDNTHEWCAAGVEPAIANLQGIAGADAPWWVEQLRTLPGLVIPRVHELPPEAPLERHLLESHGVRSCAAVPLTDFRLGLIGFIGFDYVHSDRAWLDEDVRVLQTLAEMFVTCFSRVRAEKEVLRREGILQAVSFAAERFLSATDWEEGLDEALALIGAAAGVSRAYLFQTQPGDDGRILVGQRAEWVADGVEPQMPSRGFEYASLVDLGLGRWEALFRGGETLQGMVSTLPEYERMCLSAQGIRSVLQIPIHVEGEWWGTLGIDNCREEREWSPTEVEALATAAGMIAAAVQRKRSEEALRESEERFRQMAESMREVFFMVSAAGNELIYLSPSYEVVWGRSRGDRHGFFESILPEDRHIVLADMALSASGTGDPLRHIEYRIARPDGSIRWIRHRVFQVLDAEGRPYRVTGVCSDITEQKELEEELRRANRLEAIGHLAAGIAHEINTPIQYIGDNVRFLDESYTEVRRVLDAYAVMLADAAAGSVSPERVAEVSALIERADLEYLLEEAPRASSHALDGVQRVAEIVRAMKEFSHPGSGQKVPTDLNQAIRSTTTVARNEWKYIAELEADLDESLPLVSCLPGEINQAILNLVVNAAHAIAERRQREQSEATGTIRIETAAAGDHVEIRVSDTGTGIPEEIRRRVFDPFFTTKEVGRGTGQGLTFVHSIVVEKHGGTVSFTTEPGVGTTFVLRLPCVPTRGAMSEAA